MKKLIAVLLASVMVACCFAISASAADTNLVAGNDSYVLSADDGVVGYQGMCEDGINNPVYGFYAGQALLTDGEYRTGTEDAPIAKDAVAGTTIELPGTNRVYSYEFNLGGSYALSSIVFRVAKIGGNRSFNVVKVEVSDDGQTWTEVNFTKTFDVIENAEEANAAFAQGGSDPRAQFFDVTASFEATGSYVKVSFDTSNPGTEYYNFYVDNGGNTERGYVASFDEIEVYGSAAGEEPSEDPSEEDPSEDPSVDDPSEDAPVVDPSEDAPSEEPSVDDSSVDAPVEDPSEDAPVESTPVEDDSSADDEPTTPGTGDAGLAVFAVLAVVSLAGVVVAKKVK